MFYILENGFRLICYRSLSSFSNPHSSSSEDGAFKEFTAKLDSLRSELEEAHGLQLADIKEALRREHESDIVDWNEKYDRLNAELLACQKDRNNFETQTKNWKASYDQLRQETLKYRLEVTESLKDLRVKYERLEASLVEEQKRNESIETRKRVLEKEVEKLIGDNAAMESHVTALQGEKDSLQRKTTDRDGQILKLTADLERSKILSEEERERHGRELDDLEEQFSQAYVANINDAWEEIRAQFQTRLEEALKKQKDEIEVGGGRW